MDGCIGREIYGRGGFIAVQGGMERCQGLKESARERERQSDRQYHDASFLANQSASLAG